mmetsp:Transcript_60667/g.94322  ORF Transcript_60667/g.94322 Transcript_60667/m.94322 type:complete len:543 (+) Transcript_60667:3-1631(+)
MAKITVLDGGMGHELRRRGVKIEGPIGSQKRFLGVALANENQPELVCGAHAAYLEAGADVITTNNYAVVPKTLAMTKESTGTNSSESKSVQSKEVFHHDHHDCGHDHGHDHHDCGHDHGDHHDCGHDHGDEEHSPSTAASNEDVPRQESKQYHDSDLEVLTKFSVDRAREAIDASRQSLRQKEEGCNKNRPLIAGALPPLAASYRADQVPTDEEGLEKSLAAYKRIARTLVQASVGVLLAETMSCVREAVVATKAAVAAVNEKKETVKESGAVASGITVSVSNPTAVVCEEISNPTAVLCETEIKEESGDVLKIVAGKTNNGKISRIASSDTIATMDTLGSGGEDSETRSGTEESSKTQTNGGEGKETPTKGEGERSQTTKPAQIWVSFTLREDTSGCLRSGESIEEAVETLHKEGLLLNIDAVLFNCCHVDSVSAALPRLRAVLDKCATLDNNCGTTKESSQQIGAYANSFVTAKSDGKGSDYDKDCTPEAYADIAVDTWVKEHGASIIGGCCGIFPEHIAELRKRVDALNKLTFAERKLG